MTRKLKILMLCGQGQNAAVFRGKTEPIRRDIDKNVEFVFVDPPYLSIRPTLSSADYSQPQLDSVLDDNGTTVQKRPENIPRLWSFSGDLNAKDYRDIFGKDWDVVDCLKLVRRVMEEEGPFDACVGFSTGSTLAAIVMALLQNPKLHPVFDAPGPNWPPKQFEFAILAAGFYPSDKKIQMWFDDKIRTPTLMVLGTGDTVVGDVHSIPLTRCFANPRIEWHSGGHFIPTKPSWRAFFKAYVEQYLTDDTPRPELVRSPSPTFGRVEVVAML
ncbi:dihydrofolate reductase [Pseudohyphozyma bogoriensis]|nr:dihydrofolate reductase [Pseudohyphozyma bogoriensis]